MDKTDLVSKPLNDKFSFRDEREQWLTVRYLEAVRRVSGSTSYLLCDLGQVT